VLLSPRSAGFQRYDKIHLVPFGEYIPLRNSLRFLGAIVPIDDFTAGDEFTIMRFRLRDTGSEARCAVLICFEDVFPEIARGFARRGVDILVGITNDAWFGDTASPWQHLQAAVFRAVETRRPVVRAANTGVSCFISNKGSVTSLVRDEKGKQTFTPGFRVATVRFDPHATLTLYTRFGDLFVGLCCIGCLCGLGLPIRRRV
jgi:apolipoprotein N-acyltransferase